MQPSTWIMMIAVMGLIWGGFIGLLVFALGKERGKRGNAER